MNKLEALLKENPCDGSVKLEDIMNGAAANRNLSKSICDMIDSFQLCPWVVQDGNLFWIHLYRAAGAPRLSGRNIVRWVLIRHDHMNHSMNHLHKLFMEGGSWLS